MNIVNLVHASDRNEWRKWLSENFKKEKEAWLVFPSIKANEKSVDYNDAVEEALCFGWIDSTAKGIDPLHSARHFTPRRAGSSYSRPNIERLIWLDQRSMIHPEVRKTVLNELTEPYVFPKDILMEIEKDPAVLKNYQNFSDSYKRIRVAYIDAARKRPQEFKKRLENFINKTRDNKLITGYGGIEKYYG